jgi:uncharacterized membrane protein YdbT with pleckstrin-like domain
MSLSDLSEVPKLMRPSEKVIWRGQPHKASFMMKGYISSAFGLVWLSFSLFAMYIFLWASPAQGFELIVAFVLSLFVLIGVGLTVGPTVWQVMRYKHTHFVITNQRLITQTGAIGVDTRFINLDHIQEVYVNVSFIDKLFGTGSLIVVTAGLPFLGRMYPVMTGLKEPYHVQQRLQEARSLTVLL